MMYFLQTHATQLVLGLCALTVIGWLIYELTIAPVIHDYEDHDPTDREDL
ncbi:hypothetical protein GCM10027275_50180 [Rhabdobacter roseus]|uniref:Uncharacterized protein n=1 Tax=Rhabdobacter roseus TaxID=1655419 RepID=A0A840U4S5_9BACT|nr:hypothetical protein [Rhabdobacter roseus]MBB5287090.1 hypothetical protein [Rhabdobacter roseus]